MVRPILTILQVIALPIAFFRYFSMVNHSLEFWMPLIIELTVQVLFHLLSFIYYYFIHKDHWKTHFVTFHYATAFRDFPSVGHILVSGIFGKEFLHIPIEMTLFDCLIAIPFEFIFQNLIHFHHSNDSSTGGNEPSIQAIHDGPSSGEEEEDKGNMGVEERFENSNSFRLLIILLPAWILFIIALILSLTPYETPDLIELFTNDISIATPGMFILVSGIFLGSVSSFMDWFEKLL